APMGPSIVTVNHVGVTLGATAVVVAGNHQPAAAKLNTISRSRGIPRPIGALHLGGDLDGNAPRSAIVGAPCEPNRAVALSDVALHNSARIASHEDDHQSTLALHDRGGIADGIAARIRDDL